MALEDRVSDPTRGVTVEETRCVGSGECTRVAPGAFTIDEERGLAVVVEGVSAIPLDRLQRAARECPTGAIRVDSTSRPAGESP